MICAFSNPLIERTNCNCTSNGRLVEIPFGYSSCVVQAFRLDENLVRCLVGKAMNLVFNRWAVARADAFDHAGVHRRTIESTTDHSCVRALVCVTQQQVCCGCSAAEPMKLITGIGVSPHCCCRPSKLTERASIRGGVPVFSRSTRNGSSRRRCASAIDGGSPARPPDVVLEADVDLAAEESTGAQHHRRAQKNVYRFA